MNINVFTKTNSWCKRITIPFLLNFHKTIINTIASIYVITY